MIFLDTGFAFALVCRRDENHERVRAVMNEYRGRDLQQLVLTSNHLVEETITCARASTAIQAWPTTSPWTSVASSSPASSDGSTTRAQSTEALAVDEDFTHRFTARPGPRPKAR